MSVSATLIDLLSFSLVRPTRDVQLSFGIHSLSTIHAYADWHTPQPSDTTIHRMLEASNAWQPDQKTWKQVEGSPLYLARASFFNTPQSRNESIFSSPCGNYWLTANARLDNREALIQALIPGKGPAKPEASTDGQLILLAYMRWGQECLGHLLGDFAFILWDNTEQSIFCARDPMGIKSLFFATLPTGKVLISNECEAMLNTGLVTRRLSHAWLAQQLLPGCQQGFVSEIEGIDKLEPGHFMMISSNGVATKRYWEMPHLNLEDLDEKGYLRELYSRLETAIQRRLGSDYPIGCELSEGLDSSAIAALAARLKAPETVFTFSYQCEKKTKANHHIWGETYKDIEAQLAMHPNLTPLWREVNTEAPATPISERLATRGAGFLQPDLLAHNSIRTLLSGWGGDHCVTSYGDYYEDELFRQGKFKQLQKLMAQKRARGRGITPWKGWLMLAAKHVWPKLYRNRVTYRHGLTGQLFQNLNRHPLNFRSLKTTNVHCRTLNFIEAYEKKSVRQRDHRELFEVTPERRLTESEMAARLARVEYRFPMLDTELLTWAYNAPPHLKIKEGVERYMFREIMKGVLTERNRTRRKADVSHPNRDQKAEASEKRNALISKLTNNYNPKLAALMPLNATVRYYQQLPPQGSLRPLECLVAVNDRLNQGTLELELRVEHAH